MWHEDLPDLPKIAQTCCLPKCSTGNRRLWKAQPFSSVQAGPLCLVPEKFPRRRSVLCPGSNKTSIKNPGEHNGKVFTLHTRCQTGARQRCSVVDRKNKIMRFDPQIFQAQHHPASCHVRDKMEKPSPHTWLKWQFELLWPLQGTPRLGIKPNGHVATQPIWTDHHSSIWKLQMQFCLTNLDEITVSGKLIPGPAGGLRFGTSPLNKHVIW